jgi:hypothetical protein
MQLFTTDTWFGGGSNRKPEDLKLHTYRFSVKRNEQNALEIDAEQRNPDTGAWRKVAGWHLETIFGTEGIYVDFGQGWYIRPTPEVWSEIKHKLNDTKAARELFRKKAGD